MDSHFLCGGGSAPDLIYQITPLSTGLLTATIEIQGSFEGFLRFHDTCEGTEIDCTNDTLSLMVEKDVPIFMAVDGHEPNPQGAFTVRLNLYGCGNGVIEGPEECDDGGRGSGQCTDTCTVICDVGDSASSDEQFYLDPVTHHCYMQVYTPNSTWSEAQADCFSWGGDLASLSTTAEINTLAPLINNTFEDVWIGGHDVDQNGTFAWVSGDPWIYANKQAPWAANEPSGGEDCVEIYKNAKLNDQGCGVSQNYLCERPPIGQPATPP
ncbi:MAG: hypothetical protein IPK82_19020 [Polyangiaceae bacterium]|nr:hypothetical protein [Polyangiaceae bacterium]